MAEGKKRTLGDLSVYELLASARDELAFARDIAEGNRERTIVLSDGEPLDLLTTAMNSVWSRIAVAEVKLTEIDHG